MKRFDFKILSTGQIQTVITWNYQRAVMIMRSIGVTASQYEYIHN